jgi:hypothetical protein
MTASRPFEVVPRSGRGSQADGQGATPSQSFRSALMSPENGRPFTFGLRMLPVVTTGWRSPHLAARPRCEERRTHRRS